MAEVAEELQPRIHMRVTVCEDKNVMKSCGEREMGKKAGVVECDKR